MLIFSILQNIRCILKNVLKDDSHGVLGYSVVRMSKKYELFLIFLFLDFPAVKNSKFVIIYSLISVSLFFSQKSGSFITVT